VGGDASGAGLRLDGYTNNLLNQITSRAVPGTNDIQGIAHASATVTVNGQSTYRKGEYFWKDLPIANQAGPALANVTTVGAMAGTTNTTIGKDFLPQNPEVFGYDADGNLTNDGHWSYTWDGENRLLTMQSSTAVSPVQHLDFRYDSQGRRISKTVSNQVSGVWTLASDLRFAYAGWNLLAILNPQSSILQSFVWGLDLSGSLQGAGGVGGLLSISDSVNGVQWAAYDGNGNVVALAKAADGTVAASYEYGPFGELIRQTAADPVPRSGPQLWLNADGLNLSQGAAVSQWTDQSGRNIILSQGTSSLRPLFQTALLNGHAAVQFDGADEFLRTSVPIDLWGGSDDVTLFVVTSTGSSQWDYADILDFDHATAPYDGFVIQQQGGNANQFYWTYYTGGSWQGNASQAQLTVGGAPMFESLTNGSSLAFYVNGQTAVSQTVSSGAAKATNLLTLGNCTAPFARPFNGAIAEVLIYNRALNSAERLGVENYLSQEYGIAVASPVPTNPFRFSTKYQDVEADLVYYGFRYYNLITGRWVSRDTRGEQGGHNLCAFVGNVPEIRLDALGLYAVSDTPD